MVRFSRLLAQSRARVSLPLVGAPIVDTGT